MGEPIQLFRNSVKGYSMSNFEKAFDYVWQIVKADDDEMMRRLGEGMLSDRTHPDDDELVYDASDEQDDLRDKTIAWLEELSDPNGLHDGWHDVGDMARLALDAIRGY